MLDDYKMPFTNPTPGQLEDGLYGLMALWMQVEKNDLQKPKDLISRAITLLGQQLQVFPFAVTHRTGGPIGQAGKRLDYSNFEKNPQIA